MMSIERAHQFEHDVKNDQNPHVKLQSDSREPPLNRAELIAAAVAIGDQLRALATRDAEGETTWLSFFFDPSTKCMNSLPMTDILYDGRIGIALFLAALEDITGGEGFRDLALSAMLSLRKTLQQSTPPVTGRITLGGGAGLGGQLYALVRIASWLSDGELLDLAGRVAGRFTPERIARDEELDVLGGAAGGILGLLAFSSASTNGDGLNEAVQCGDHLLRKRHTSDTGHRAWPVGWASRPLTGFSHGAAGIAYSLLRLHQATGEHRFREAAEEAIAYEAAVYSPEAGNWPDFRVPPGPSGDQFVVAWCHGATGIGLARLGGLRVLDTPAVRMDIANALESTLTDMQCDVDHLCCGELGRVDLLIEASLRLKRAELLDEAGRQASRIVRLASRTGRYRLYNRAQSVTDNPSLFQGTAGIGYELLRLAEPERMPCLLLWD